MLMLVAIATLTAIFSNFSRRGTARASIQHGVGTDPGDISSRPDIEAAAKGRGHDLAAFAAG